MGKDIHGSVSESFLGACVGERVLLLEWSNDNHEVSDALNVIVCLSVTAGTGAAQRDSLEWLAFFEDFGLVVGGAELKRVGCGRLDVRRPCIEGAFD